MESEKTKGEGRDMSDPLEKLIKLDKKSCNFDYVDEFFRCWADQFEDPGALYRGDVDDSAEGERALAETVLETHQHFLLQES
jgi:hypothetical protein